MNRTKTFALLSSNTVTNVTKYSKPPNDAVKIGPTTSVKVQSNAHLLKLHAMNFHGLQVEFYNQQHKFQSRFSEGSFANLLTTFCKHSIGSLCVWYRRLWHMSRSALILVHTFWVVSTALRSHFGVSRQIMLVLFALSVDLTRYVSITAFFTIICNDPKPAFMTNLLEIKFTSYQVHI